jgi:hypothetical protein
MQLRMMAPVSGAQVAGPFKKRMPGTWPGMKQEDRATQMSRPSTFSTSDLTLSETPFRRGYISSALR